MSTSTQSDSAKKTDAKLGWWRSLRREYRPIELPRAVSLALSIAGLIIAAALPLFQPTYVNFDLSMVMVFAVAGLGLNLLTGNTGQLSLGHSAFFAIGAYIGAVMMKSELHYLLPVPVAAIACFLFGYIVGLPALKLRGLQLALATLALALVVPSAIKLLDGVTHGQEGINLYVATAPEWSGLADDQWRYYLSFAVLIIAIIVTRRMSSGRMGRTLAAIKSNEVPANTLGVRASRIKTQVFAMSAAYAGVAGVMYVWVVQFVAPEAFGLTLAISLIILVVIGGLGTVAGSVLGAFFVHFVPKYASEVNQAAGGMAYGLILIVFIFFLPYGIVGLTRALAHRFSSKKA